MRLILPSTKASGAVLLVFAGITLGNVPRGALALQPTTTIGQDEDPHCRDTMDKCKFWTEIGEVSCAGHRRAYLCSSALCAAFWRERSLNTNQHSFTQFCPSFCYAPNPMTAVHDECGVCPGSLSSELRRMSSECRLGQFQMQPVSGRINHIRGRPRTLFCHSNIGRPDHPDHIRSGHSASRR